MRCKETCSKCGGRCTADHTATPISRTIQPSHTCMYKHHWKLDEKYDETQQKWISSYASGGNSSLTPEQV